MTTTMRPPAARRRPPRGASTSAAARVAPPAVSGHRTAPGARGCSSHACSITAAATLSTTFACGPRAARAASLRLRSARDGREPLVVRDHVDVGVDRRAAAPRSPARAARAAGPFAPDSDSGSPTTIVVSLARGRELDDRAVIGAVRRGRAAGPCAATRPCATGPTARGRCGPIRGRRRAPAREASPARRCCGRHCSRLLAHGRSASSIPSAFGAAADHRVGALADAAAERLRRRARDRVGRDARRVTRSLLTATAMPAFTPSGPVPASATTPEPSARTVSCASRRSSSLLRPSRRATTAPPVACAASSAGRGRRVLRLEPLQLVLQRAHLLGQALDLVGDLLRARRAADRPRGAAAPPRARRTRARRRR